VRGLNSGLGLLVGVVWGRTRFERGARSKGDARPPPPVRGEISVPLPHAVPAVNRPGRRVNERRRDAQ